MQEAGGRFQEDELLKAELYASRQCLEGGLRR